MKLKIAPSEHLSFRWTKVGPSPSWSWTNQNGSKITENEGEPLTEPTGHASVGAPGHKIPGVCIAVTFTDVAVEFTAQEP